jgi:O-methyltransferase
MKRRITKIIAFLKGLILFLRPHFFFGWLRQPFLMMSNTLSLASWISKQEKFVFNDFFSPFRDYSKRYSLYQHVVDTLKLKDEPIDYLEFGVFRGDSVKWWVNSCANADCKFYGFDTFEGLPEDWGMYKKGEMNASIPKIDDQRVEFIQGLFQNSVPDFITNTNLRTAKRKVIHLDADLFSSTLFALTSLAPYLKKGDILLFDEFNVPNHEFFAFKIFCESYYVKTKLLGAVNNYFQVALMIE